MDLSSPKLKKILIFAAIFTVIVFIIVKIWRRSYYSYPNTSEDAQVMVTAMSLASPTMTVSAPGHNFKVGDIVLLKNVGFTSFSLSANVMPTVAGTQGTPVIVATSTPGTSFTFGATAAAGAYAAGGTAESVGFGVMTTLKSNLVACQDTYARDIINGVSNVTANATRITCIANSVAPYTRNHCQWLPPVGGTLPIPGSGMALTAYTAYQDNIKTIQLAYVQPANRAAAGTFSGIGSTSNASTIVSAARAADISGATQKYLATVCPGFYQPGDPAVSDPSAGYIAWTAVLSSNVDSITSTQKHFYASNPNGITDAAILTWAQYARPVTFVANTGLSASFGYLSAAPNGTGNITVSGTAYSDKSGNGGNNTENWRSAYINGPGTFPVSPTWAS